MIQPPQAVSQAKQALPEDARILLVRFSSLGDVVKCTALPRLIKNRYPRAQVTFLTSEAHVDLVRHNPHLHQAIGFQRKQGLPGLFRLARQLAREDFHLVADVHNSLRSRLLRGLIRAPRTVYHKRTLQRFLLIQFGINTYHYDADGRTAGKEDDFLAGLRPYGITDDGQGTEMHLGPQFEAAHLSQKLPDALRRLKAWRGDNLPILGAAPVAAWDLKRWPLDHWRSFLAAYLKQVGGGLILFGGPRDSDVIQLGAQLERQAPQQVISLAGRTTLLESAWFASHTSLMLANDTGMMHISEAMGVDVLAFFGPTSRELGYFPVRAESGVLERPLPCRPCTRNGKGKCSHPWPKACLAAIEPGMVLSAVKQKLGR